LACNSIAQLLETPKASLVSNSAQNQQNTIVRMSIGDLLKEGSKDEISNMNQIEIKLPSCLFLGQSNIIDLDQLDATSTMEKQRLKSIKANLIELIQNFM